MAAIFQQLFSECPLVDQATEDNDTATPGYVFNDIIRMGSVTCILSSADALSRRIVAKIGRGLRQDSKSPSDSS